MCVCILSTHLPTTIREMSINANTLSAKNPNEKQQSQNTGTNTIDSMR